MQLAPSPLGEHEGFQWQIWRALARGRKVRGFTSRDACHLVAHPNPNFDYAKAHRKLKFDHAKALNLMALCLDRFPAAVNTSQSLGRMPTISDDETPLSS